MEKKYIKRTVIESGNLYTADLGRYDFLPEDCVVTDEPEYRAPSSAAKYPLVVAFLLKDLKNVTLDFGGAELVFHGRIVPFILDGCENVTIRNCMIDYDRPFYTETHILDVSEDRLALGLKDGFPCRVEGGNLVAVSTYWENRLNHGDLLMQPYDPATGVPASSMMLALIGDEIFPYPDPPLPVHHLRVVGHGDKTVTLSGKFPPNWRPGTDLAFTHEIRDKNTFTAVGCTGITLENVRIFHGAAMGFVGMHSRDLIFRRFDMYRDEAHPNYVTNNADAIHTFGCSGKICIEDCRMDSMLDDSLNVHGNFTVTERVGGKNIIARSPGKGMTNRMKNYLPGTKIAVYNGQTTEQKRTLTVAHCEPDSKDERLFVLTTEEDAADVCTGDLIENLSGNADVTVRNCTFGRFRGTMRIQTRGTVLIENCSFANPNDNVLFSGDSVYWYESGPVRNVMLENCRFGGAINACPQVMVTKKEPYYHSGIQMESCRFATDIIFKGIQTDRMRFVGNTCDSGKIPTVKLCGCGICEADCTVVRE